MFDRQGGGVRGGCELEVEGVVISNGVEAVSWVLAESGDHLATRAVDEGISKARKSFFHSIGAFRVTWACF